MWWQWRIYYWVQGNANKHWGAQGKGGKELATLGNAVAGVSREYIILLSPFNMVGCPKIIISLLQSYSYLSTLAKSLPPLKSQRRSRRQVTAAQLR